MNVYLQLLIIIQVKAGRLYTKKLKMDSLGMGERGYWREEQKQNFSV